MKSSGMRRISAPGLPPYPKLKFDPVKRRAIVSARHATWRSVEWALRCTEVLVWTSNLGLAWFIWQRVPPYELSARVAVFLLALAVCLPIATFAIRQALPGFLARRMFATKTVLWFTPDGIAFRSRLYEKPVIVWRRWNGRPVRVRFIVQPDDDAASYANGADPRQRKPLEHLREARMLEIVLTTVNRQRNTDLNNEGTILRSIPITEINGRLAMKFTMVYTAAVMLTGSSLELCSRPPSDGVDIDAV